MSNEVATTAGKTAAGGGQHEFDYRAQVNIQHRQAELAADHAAYMRAHPELQQVLHDLTQALVIAKPDDPLTFIRTHFEQCREKREPYKFPE